MNVIEAGYITNKKFKVSIVISRFNNSITKLLLDGAVDTLNRNGISEENIDVVWVPGAFEIPLIAQKMANLKKYDAIITLGCIIKGATSHYDYICNTVSNNIAQIGLQNKIPIIFGILTTENIEQAIERSGTKLGNKGNTSALDAIEMINLNDLINKKIKN